MSHTKFSFILNSSNPRCLSPFHLVMTTTILVIRLSRIYSRIFRPEPCSPSSWKFSYTYPELSEKWYDQRLPNTAPNILFCRIFYIGHRVYLGTRGKHLGSVFRYYYCTFCWKSSNLYSVLLCNLKHVSVNLYWNFFHIWLTVW